MTRSNHAGCLIYARMSAADLTRARQLARGDMARLDELIAEKITAHLDECRRFAGAAGWPVLGEHHDNMVSGNSRYRRISQQLTGRDAMLADLRERTGQRVIVLSTEIARFYRDTDESRELVRLAKTTPITVYATNGEDDGDTDSAEHYDLTTAEGEAGYEAAVSKAQRESAKVSERRRRKERIRAEDGGYWGNEPFGAHKVYSYDEGTGQRYYTGRLELCTGTCCDAVGTPACPHHGNGCWLTPGRLFAPKPGFWTSAPGDYDDGTTSEDGHPIGEAEWIVMAAQSLTRGASLSSVTRFWDSVGLTTRNGERWSQMMIRALLLNKRLTGIRVHRPGTKWGRADRKSEGTESNGLWDAILDDELAAAVRGVLLDPERSRHVAQGHSRGVRRHLLAGLAECGNVLGPEFGVREGQPCGTKMAGHPAPRSGDSRSRQYQCPRVHGGCGHCRRNTEIADRWVIQHVLHWTAPGGPYEEFVARERALHDAGRAAVTAEVAAIGEELQAADKRLAALQAEIASGDIEPGTSMWTVVKGAARQIEEDKAALAARRAKLMAAAPPPSAEDARADLEPLTDPDAPIAVRADLVRRFVSRVIIYPPGQGIREFDPATIEVIPGPWADGLDAATLAVPDDGSRPASPRAVILAYLGEHPGATAKQIAVATRRAHSTTSTMLARMREAGEVIPDREPSGGRVLRYTLPG
jgi:DNA invertase Pin-like site-specific DNA recombinase